MKALTIVLVISWLPIWYSLKRMPLPSSTKSTAKEIAYPRLSKDSNKILYQSNQNGNWQL
jgi:hypothetical protein